METDTIVARFIKKFGAPLSLPEGKKAPLILGTELPSFGLTFDAPTVLESMFKRFGSVPTLIETEPVKLLPKLEYECRDRDDTKNLICSWSTKRLVTGFSVLDSKPYSRCTVKFSTVEFPILVTRQIGKVSASLFIAPEEWTVRTDGYTVPVTDGIENIPYIDEDHIETQWLTHMFGTTWWVVHYSTPSGYSEYTGRCSNCGTEVLLTDLNNIIHSSHPQCFCWCTCEECEKRRYKKEFIDTMQWYSRKKWQ